MKTITLLSIAGFALAPFASLQASAISAGDLLVFQAGTSSVAVSTTASQLVIDEINPSLTNQTSPVQSFDISTMANPLYTNNQGSTGDLTLSDNGTLLSFAGWEGTNGSSAENVLTTRGAGTLSAAGIYTQAASYTGATTKVTRSAYSPDGTNWYFGESSGVYTQGGTAPLAGSPSIYDIQGNGTTTYGMVATSGSTVIGTITPATPNGTGFVYGGLSGMPVDKNAVGFTILASGSSGAGVNDTIYVADDASGSTNYIDKFSLVGSTWVSSGSFGIGSTVNIDQLIAKPVGGGNVDIFYTTNPSSSNGYDQVDEIVDTSGFDHGIALSGSTTLFTTGVANTTDSLLGISFAPVPEPGTIGIVVFGGAMLLGASRFRRGSRKA